MGLAMAEKLYRVKKERLKQLRVRNRMTQEQLAHAAGLSKGHITCIERGQHQSPHFATIEKLAEVLGVDADYLIEYVDPDAAEEEPQYPGDARSERDFDEFLDYEEERRNRRDEPHQPTPEEGEDGESRS